MVLQNMKCCRRVLRFCAPAAVSGRHCHPAALSSPPEERAGRRGPFRVVLHQGWKNKTHVAQVRVPRQDSRAQLALKHSLRNGLRRARSLGCPRAQAEQGERSAAAALCYWLFSPKHADYTGIIPTTSLTNSRFTNRFDVGWGSLGKYVWSGPAAVPLQIFANGCVFPLNPYCTLEKGILCPKSSELVFCKARV